MALWLVLQGDDGDDGAWVFGADGVALGVGGDGDACVILKQPAIHESIFSRAEAFRAIGSDAMEVWS